MLFMFRSLFDMLVDYVFGLFYNFNNQRINGGPSRTYYVVNVDHPFLMDSVVTLARKIRNKELKSVDVVKAYIDRIAQVNDALNAVVDERYESALQEASMADKMIEDEKWTVDALEQERPFHGVPFTAKESTAVKGLHHSIGLVCRRDCIAQEDAEVVELLRRAGAIPLAVTNVPELCMWYETRCNVYGQTNNPYDCKRMVGGSSGGESSLLAACGSPFGIGTDIGGSLRMPAFFCGIFAHKPTTGITPLRGLSYRVGGEKSMTVAGPMSRHAEDLKPLLSILAQINYKPCQPSLGLNVKVDMRQVKICYMEDDGGDLAISPVCSDLRAAMHKALDHLKEVTVEPPKKIHLSRMKYGRKLWRYMLTKEPGRLVNDLTNRKSTVIWWRETLKYLIGKSDYTLPSIIRLIDQLLPQVNPEWAENNLKKLMEELKTELGDNGVLLYPSHPYPALYHYVAFFRPYNFSYTSAINALNIPATQVPLGLNKDGLPLGIQVVSTKYNDRLCLAVAEELERGCGGWVPPFNTY